LNFACFFVELHIILEYPVVDSPHILLISFSFYFQFHQLVQICSCCLLDDIASNEQHKKMKNEAFIHQNQRVSLVDAYSDVNGWPPVSDIIICETCTNLLESVYVFRQLCQLSDQPIYNVCRCCLQEKSDSNDEFLDMRNTVFEHNNTTVTLFVGYFDVNNSLDDSANITISEAIICEDCAGQLKSAYAFRKMCQKTAEILLQTFEREQNKEISVLLRTHNTNKKKSRNADKKRSVIKINVGQSNLKSRRPHLKQQISFSFNCKKCPKTFKSKISLSSHKKIKHRDVRTTRDLYARVWKRKSTFRLSGRVKQNFCEKCQIVFKTEQSHSIHNRSVHQMDHTVLVSQQQDSDKVFNSSPGLNIPNTSFLQKIQYRCKKCPKAFQSKYSRTNHVHIVHLNKSYDCKDCDKVFKSPQSLYQHKLGHSKPYKCENCPQVYGRQNLLLQHIRNKHENIRLACQDCDKTFTSLSGLHDHKTIIHLKKLFKCKVCDKIYKNENSLRGHTKFKHLNKTFQCEKCSKIFQRKDDFIVHYRSKHLNILLACQDCEKVFTSKTGLYSHKARIHLKILYQCQKCKKTFSEKRGLRIHVENIHKETTFLSRL
jgi:KRAB domain-containing zinc finger protein